MEPKCSDTGEGQVSGPRREASEMSLQLPSSMPGGRFQTVGQGVGTEPAFSAVWEAKTVHGADWAG